MRKSMSDAEMAKTDRLFVFWTPDMGEAALFWHPLTSYRTRKVANTATVA